MSECQDILAVSRRHRSRRTDAEIAVDKRHADRLPACERRIIARVELRACTGAAKRQQRDAVHRKLVLQIAQPRRIKPTREKIRLLLCRTGRLVRCISVCIGVLCARSLLCCRLVGRRRGILCLFTVQRRDHSAPLCLAFLTRHLRKCLLACPQAAFLLRLLALFQLLHQINRRNTCLILRVWHGPEWCHILDRRDEERIGTEILQPRRKCADQASVHIDGAAAHPLEHTADLLDEVSARARHNHALIALAPLHAPDDLHGKTADLARRVKHCIGRPLQPWCDLAVRENRGHRMNVRCVKIYRQRKKRRRCKAFQRISQNVTSKNVEIKMCYNRVYPLYCSTHGKITLVFSPHPSGAFHEVKAE